MTKRLLFLLVSVATLFFSFDAEASHFRYGTINWTVPDPQNAPLTVEFTVMGIPCLGLNGGPTFKHSEAFSFQVLSYFATADSSPVQKARRSSTVASV